MYLHRVFHLLKETERERERERKREREKERDWLLSYRQLFEMNSIIRNIRGRTIKSILREYESRKEISRKMTRIARINASLFFFRSVRRGNEKTKRGKNVGNWKIIVRP